MSDPFCFAIMLHLRDDKFSSIIRKESLEFLSGLAFGPSMVDLERVYDIGFLREIEESGMTRVFVDKFNAIPVLTKRDWKGTGYV